MTSVLHVIPALTRGGPGRALLSAVAATATAAPELTHAVASLEAPDPLMAAGAADLGIAALPPGALAGEMERADVVQVHFWNTPALYELLDAELPACRLVLWAHVSGAHAPQVLPGDLLERVDLAIASTPHTTSLPGLVGLPVIPAIADVRRIPPPGPREDRPLTVGYIGKLDFAKLHPRFVAMCAQLDVPDARFVLYGAGAAAATLRRQATAAGLGDRMDLPGFVEDIGAALAGIDVFACALADDTSAASELALQEAMLAGVPPVVLAPAAVRDIVRHDETGLVAETEQEFVAALARLADPAERRRLGAAARVDALRAWSPEAVGRRWAEAYDAILERPKRARPAWRGGDGAQRFLRGLGGVRPEFVAALEGDMAAERLIGRASPVLCTGDGGILDYRDRHPEDPHLRLWAGLALRGQGRHALAAGELAAAQRLGLGHARVERRLSAARRAAAGAPPLVSVVMAVLDAEAYLAEAIESVRTQSYPHHELVIVDGGSRDRSRAIASGYEGVRVLDQRGSGFADAWNQGVAASAGELVAFLDGDDVWQPEKLARQVELLETDPALDAVIARARFVAEPGAELPGAFPPELLDGDHVANMPSALLVRRESFEAVGPFRTDFAVANDIDWFARAKDLPLTLAVVQEMLVIKRVHTDNLSLSATAAAHLNGEVLMLLRASVRRQSGESSR